jgi:hypothetical protein
MNTILGVIEQLTRILVSVHPLKESIADVKAAWKSQISFATPGLMRTVLTAKRWEILKALCGGGLMTFREAAKLEPRA